jgi:hypothetical protein
MARPSLNVASNYSRKSNQTVQQSQSANLKSYGNKPGNHVDEELLNELGGNLKSNPSGGNYKQASFRPDDTFFHDS